ncbi:MAG: tripartite tricarboxylate transporter TctB family protein [Tropicimonas sp.]|uniref:tripartite tricarboxylate transporter TctB family protein n=1 Tax=Tropicimonas sp. TaxID=2067044 RepID=UPI003A83C3B2
MTNVASRDRARRNDLFAGAFWIIFGGAITAHSSTMPIPEHLGASLLTGPGLAPALLGVGLATLGMVLVLRSLRDEVVTGPDDEVDPTRVSNGRALLALVLMVAYAAAFALRQPFVPCTIAFVTLFVTFFNWQGRGTAERMRVLAGAFALGLATGFAVEFVFETIFYIRLP